MNSRLLNVSTVMFAVLTVSIGMFVYNSAQTTITDSLDSISTQEMESFNSMFSRYEGEQTGSNIKALIGRLIANADTYRAEVDKIPGIIYEKKTEDEMIEQVIIDHIETEDNLNDYIQNLGMARNEIETKHYYYVEITYQENGLIDYIHISYDPSNSITDLRYR